MKKAIIIGIISIILSNVSNAQSEKYLPTLNIENLNGKQISASTIHNTDGPTFISFWATWCKPCILELNEIQDLYSDWHDETKVKVIAISIDDARSSRKVPAFVNGKSWDFDIYLDKNSELKRALNISNVPYSLLLNKEGKIVWQHTGYSIGDEELVYEELLKLIGE